MSLGKKILKTSPVGYAAAKAIEKQNDPDAQAAKQAKQDEKQAKRDDKPIAKVAVGIRSIRLYADGRIEHKGKTQSVIGATARVDASGSKRMFRDTREVFLIVEGPRVAIAEPLANKNHMVRTAAMKFATQVNTLAMQLGGQESPASVAVQDDPTEQIRKLAELRDSGILTEEEFQAKKADLLERM